MFVSLEIAGMCQIEVILMQFIHFQACFIKSTLFFWILKMESRDMEVQKQESKSAPEMMEYSVSMKTPLVPIPKLFQFPLCQ